MEQNIQKLGDNSKRRNIHIIGIPEAKKKKKKGEGPNRDVRNRRNI